MPETNKSMTDEEFVRRVAMIHEHLLKLRKDSDYVVNQPQMDRLVALLDYFIKKTQALCGKVDKVDLKPAELHGGVTANFLVFDSHGQDVQEFCRVLSYCSSVGIDSLSNGDICISCTIPNVFVPKP